MDSDIVREEQELLYGLYAQDEWHVGEKLTAVAALRADHDDLVGTVFAPKAGLLYSPSAKHSLRLTAATAYNSSSFIESYLDWTWTIPLGGGATYDVRAIGNPGLEPERILTYELGYRSFPTPEVLVDGAVFYTHLEDYAGFRPVDYYAPGLPKTFSYVDSGDARQRGIELSMEAISRRGASLAVAYSFTDTTQEDDAPGMSARHKGALTLQYNRTGWEGVVKGIASSVGAVYQDAVTYVTSTPFYPSGTVPSFTVVNGSVFVDLLEGGDLSVGVRGTNLLDRRYQEYIVGDYIERRAIVELRARF